MEKILAIMNCNCIFMNLSIQDDITHITCYVGETYAKIDIYEEFHSPKLQKIKKSVLPGCMDGTSFEFRHFEKDDVTESFSVLEIEWRF